MDAQSRTCVDINAGTSVRVARFEWTLVVVPASQTRFEVHGELCNELFV